MIKDVIIAIVSTISGTIVGCFLNSFMIGKGKVVVESTNFRMIPTYVDTYRSVDNGAQHYDGSIINKIIVSFDLLVTNKKQITCGIHNCEVYLKNKDGEKWYFIDLTEQVAAYCDNVDLLNIPGGATRNKRIEKELIGLRKKNLKGSMVVFEYKVNGKRKKYSFVVSKIKE